MAEKKHAHKECIEMFAMLSDFIDGELDAAVCKAIEKHAKECIRCNVCLETLKRTVDLCGHPKSHSVPAHLSRKLQELIQTAR